MRIQPEGPAIRVRGLSRSYGEVHAVRDVSFDVERGEVVCLLGPNGAGKTTTVEILEGCRVRSGGEVSVLATADARRRARGRSGRLVGGRHRRFDQSGAGPP